MHSKNTQQESARRTISLIIEEHGYRNRPSRFGVKDRLTYRGVDLTGILNQAPVTT
jgi:hypothetical protein